MNDDDADVVWLWGKVEIGKRAIWKQAMVLEALRYIVPCNVQSQGRLWFWGTRCPRRARTGWDGGHARTIRSRGGPHVPRLVSARRARSGWLLGDDDGRDGQ